MEQYQSVKLLIVDDNPAFTQLLEIILKEIGLEQTLVAPDYEEGCKAFDEFQPELCFLDIDLGKGRRSGIHLAEYIRKKNDNIPIIYLTSNYTEEYYHMTRHTRPSSFLNKELSKFKIEQAIDIALMLRYESSGNISLKDKTPYISQQQFFFKIGYSYKAISVKDILYFHADNKLTYAKVGEREYPTNIQLKTLEDEFIATFVRIHKTYLVNIEHINLVSPRESTVTIGTETLPIGYAYRNVLFSRLNLIR